MYPIILVGKLNSDFDEYILQYIKNHPEIGERVYAIAPETKKSITIDQIRELKKELHIKSSARLIVIREFQSATIEAQNALLKTLEDQTLNNQFIICTTQLGSVLPTILSRSTIVTTSGTKETVADQDVQQIIVNFSQSRSFSFFKEPKFQAASVEDAKQIFEQMIGSLRPFLFEGNANAAELVKHALYLSSLLSTNNLNPQLAIDNWCIFAKRVSIK